MRIDQLPYLCQVMVIVLRNKIQMIHKPHGLLETRMQAPSGKNGRFKCPQTLHEAKPCCAESSQNLRQFLGIMVIVMGRASTQFCHAARVSLSKEVIHTAPPDWLT